MYYNFIEYIEDRYYSKFNKENLLEKYNNKTNEHVSEILNEFSYIFHYILNTRPCYYWNEKVRKYTTEKLNRIINNNNIKIDSEILHYFFIAYDTYQQITEVMQDMSSLKLEEKLKNRLYRLPTYISITEGCLTNLYKVIVYIIDQTVEKDYKSQNKLNSFCEILKNNDFDLIVKDVDVNIRNAINHGGVLITNNGTVLNFYYMEGKQEKRLKIYYFDFELLINKLYDVCSGILLGITQVLNCNINILDRKNINNNKYLNFRLLALKLSLPNIICGEINDESIDNSQLNILTSINEVDRIFLIQTAIELIIQVYKNYPEYKQYHVNIENERLLICFIRLTKEDILGFINNHEKLNEYLKKAIDRGDVQIPSPEEVKNEELKEIKYYKYPTYVDDEIKILMLEDISIKERKRIKANLFVGDMQDKLEIIKRIEKAINWLKNIDNGFTNTKVHIKQGHMEADSVYLYVYHNDIRDGFGLNRDNKNCICFVDYNIDGNTTLKNGGMFESNWRKFYHERINNMEIAWIEPKYITKQKKFGRNEICWCGSGLKYKNCHGK